MAWCKGFLSLRKIDEAPQSVDDLWLDLGYLVRQRPMLGRGTREGTREQLQQMGAPRYT
jgi:hypothetical protein